jgi:hypothetical protein
VFGDGGVERFHPRLYTQWFPSWLWRIDRDLRVEWHTGPEGVVEATICVEC